MFTHGGIHTVKCYFCGRSFKNRKALFGHLQFCLERKKARDRWSRFRIDEPEFSGDLCIISRSKKPIPLIRGQHERYLAGEVSIGFLSGFVAGLESIGIVETELQRRSDEIGARAPHGAEEAEEGVLV